MINIYGYGMKFLYVRYDLNVHQEKQLFYLSVNGFPIIKEESLDVGTETMSLLLIGKMMDNYYAIHFILQATECGHTILI